MLASARCCSQLPPEWEGKWEKIPAECKLNMDEDCANACKGHHPILRSHVGGGDGERRTFVIGADSGRMESHNTDVMVTDAAGRLRGLMLIKARGDSKQAKKAAAKRVRGEAVARPKPNDADKAHLPLEEGVKLADGSTLRVSVAATPSGSMTLECFEADFIDHLLNKCLGPDQGKGALPSHAPSPAGLRSSLLPRLRLARRCSLDCAAQASCQSFLDS